MHREHQYSNHDSDKRALADALAALYSYASGVPQKAVGLAVEQRALAMRYSDQWVRAGCDLESSLIAQARVALVRSYAELLAAVPNRDSGVTIASQGMVGAPARAQSASAGS